MAGLPIVVWLSGRTRYDIVIQTFILTMGLACLASLNFELDIIEQKFASEFAFDLYVGRDSLRSSDGFVLQYVYCWPAFVLTNVWWAAIGANIAALALLYAYIASHSQRVAFFMVAPVIVNFAMFSLRDPLIGILFFVVAATISNPNPIRMWVGQTGTAIAFLLIRPENIIIIAFTHFYSLFQRYRRSAWVIFAVPVALVGMYLGLTMVPSALGIPFSGSILDLPLAINEFYERRANRWDEADGGGSNILGGQLASIPFLLRYPIQITSFFILPLPVDLKNPALGLAAIDSVVFCILVWWFHRDADRRVIILFWFYVLMVALFMNNYGNTFRLRLPAYMIMMGGLYRK